MVQIGEVAVIDLYMVIWCLIDDRRSGVQTRRSELSWPNTRHEGKLVPCLIASVPSMLEPWCKHTPSFHLFAGVRLA